MLPSAFLPEMEAVLVKAGMVKAKARRVAEAIEHVVKRSGYGHVIIEAGREIGVRWEDYGGLDPAHNTSTSAGWCRMVYENPSVPKVEIADRRDGRVVGQGLVEALLRAGPAGVVVVNIRHGAPFQRLAVLWGRGP